METSAGLAIVYNRKLLILHQTGHKEVGGYSIPKGKIEAGETVIEAAIRETYEETGISITEDMIGKEGPIVEYKRSTGKKKGKIYKRVHWFLVHIDKLEEVGLESEIVPEGQLQPEEGDWVGFVGGEDLGNKIFWRFKEPICNYLGLV